MPVNPAVKLANFATEAVVAFFVLSGAVITLAPYRGAKAYLGARFTRIVPIYLVAIVLAMLAAAARRPVPDVWQVAGNLLFLQTLGGYIVEPLYTNQALWSLSYEMTYYLVFPLVFLGTQRGVKVAGSLLLCVALGLIVSGRTVPHGIVSHVAIVFSLYPTWIFGALAVLAVRQGIGITRGTALFILGLGFAFSRVPVSTNYYDAFRLYAFGFGIGALCFHIVQRHAAEAPHYVISVAWPLRTVAVAVAVALLWWASPSIFVTKAILSAMVVALSYSEIASAAAARLPAMPFAAGLGKLLVYLGSISYAVYAIHIPLLYLMILVPIPPLAQACVIVVVTLILAHVLERRVQPRIKAFVLNRPAATRAQDAGAAR